MILVTGGTGFLGSHLIYKLVKAGKNVRAIKRGQTSFDIIYRVFSFYEADFDSFHRQIEWVNADITDIYSLDDCLPDVSEVYHAAAVVSFQPGDTEKMQIVNADGTANLVNACLNHGIRKFCHVSSIAAIGRADNDKIIDEKVIWKASRRNSNYAISKYAAEREVWRGIEEGLNAVIINPSIILGPGEINSGSTRMIATVEKGLKYYTRGINGFVDVRDVAEIMIMLMESDVSAERFIVSAENVPYKELFTYIADNLRKPAPKYPARIWMSEIYWRFERFKSLLTSNKPLVTKETATTANNYYRYTSEKIRSKLNFEFIPIQNAIRDACAFYLRGK